MAEPQIVKTVNIPTGIEAYFDDTHRATLTIDGAACTCHRNCCVHFEAALPHYKIAKWKLAEWNRNFWGMEKYRSIGIDPQIFFPPKVVWHEQGGEWVRLRVQQGDLYIFRDGASFWISERHPLGRTACSLCGARDCQHNAMIAEQVTA